ncbi:MAG: DNA-damage-inducible protein [Nostoc sp. NMS7]|uniref:BRO family protein n=1 Tax=Nostoc sp. NMS7 TaxID=2815391 RepID=UPI0025EC90CF|nr:BRO family protein [Nostoc sp. NMS7]MBN3949400.1 DNA-damage-inducible protein [Nostoc sp. NMS7]
MSDLTLTNDGVNPFDQIRLLDAEGIEYWVARDLMPILGYQQWRRFYEAISRAIAACQNMGHEIEKHFLPTVAKSIGGRPGDDYKLSRYACYLTAMNGDSRKPEIAAAQNYFAVKTREAELAPQSQELVSQLLSKFEEQSQVIKEQGRVIAELQSQVQNLLPISADFIPPGWDAPVWEKLPLQDKRHFRFMFRRRRFRPGNESDVKTLPAITSHQVRLQQKAEVERLTGVVSEEEKQRFDALKQQVLKQYRSFGGES